MPSFTCTSLSSHPILLCHLSVVHLCWTAHLQLLQFTYAYHVGVVSKLYFLSYLLLFVFSFVFWVSIQRRCLLCLVVLYFFSFLFYFICFIIFYSCFWTLCVNCFSHHAYAVGRYGIRYILVADFWLPAMKCRTPSITLFLSKSFDKGQ